MRRYRFPAGMRYSKLSERKQFYAEEFDLKKVENWLKDRAGMTRFAVIIGRHTRIYPKKYEQDASATIVIDEYSSLHEVEDIIREFIPESVYYDRNLYDKDGHAVEQELAFDPDPENIVCPIHGSLEDKMKRHQGLSFCKLELQMVKQETMKLYDYLEKLFSNMQIVYSGRGFHIHVLDKESYVLRNQQRKRLAEQVRTKGFPIDPWVTSGSMRLMRLPYSLHGMVSRIVVPIERNEMEIFNPTTDSRCIPSFLKKGKTHC